MHQRGSCRERRACPPPLRKSAGEEHADRARGEIACPLRKRFGERASGRTAYQRRARILANVRHCTQDAVCAEGAEAKGSEPDVCDTTGATDSLPTEAAFQDGAVVPQYQRRRERSRLLQLRPARCASVPQHSSRVCRNRHSQQRDFLDRPAGSLHPVGDRGPPSMHERPASGRELPCRSSR